jgi:hypothetical protein
MRDALPGREAIERVKPVRSSQSERLLNMKSPSPAADVWWRASGSNNEPITIVPRHAGNGRRQAPDRSRRAPVVWDVSEDSAIDAAEISGG